MSTSSHHINGNVDDVRLKRQERILRAVRGEKNDRVPLLFIGAPALVRYAKPETTFGQIARDPASIDDTIIAEVLPRLPKVDMLSAMGVPVKTMGVTVFGKTNLPGQELPENEMWQPVQLHPITEDDYDLIIRDGWQKFEHSCIVDRIGYSQELLDADMAYAADAMKKYHEAGYPFMQGNLMMPSWFDQLVFGRGLVDFFTDLVSIPDKISEVLDTMVAEFSETAPERLRQAVLAANAAGNEVMIPIAPCVHANCKFVSRDTFERFGWPLIEKQANLILDAGGYVYFHMDTNWTKFLDYFTAFPKGKCLFDSDGETDLIALRDTLGDRFALTGNVSPGLLAFGKPEDVYAECRRQIEMMGDCFILAPSCTLPANMPKENIDAMYAAI